MPLPHPPGYKLPRQTRIQHRRIVLSGVIFAFLAAVLLNLAHRAARSPGSMLEPLAKETFLLVVVGASFCGFWAEYMRQLSLVAKSKQTPE
jgi:hypothetical protein